MPAGLADLGCSRAAVFAGGFRIGLNSPVVQRDRRRLRGRDRRRPDRRTASRPYGHFPVEGSRKACGAADAEGEIRDRIQENGRCESANPYGDTYGPSRTRPTCPGYRDPRLERQVGRPPGRALDADLLRPALHLRPRARRLRYGGHRLAATLAFAWPAYPFTQYASSSNTNDPILPAFLIWGFWLATSPVARGAACRALGLDEVRPARRGAALALVPDRSSARGRKRSSSRRSSPPARSRSRSSCSTATRSTRRTSLDADARLADRARLPVLALGLVPVPRGPAGPPGGPAHPRRPPDRRRDRLLLPAAPQVAAAAGRAHGRAPARLPARPDTRSTSTCRGSSPSQPSQSWRLSPSARRRPHTSRLSVPARSCRRRLTRAGS